VTPIYDFKKGCAMAYEDDKGGLGPRGRIFLWMVKKIFHRKKRANGVLKFRVVDNFFHLCKVLP
jgi:hypothetical protein